MAPIRILVFSQVAPGAYRHASISAGVSALREMAAGAGWKLDATDTAEDFSPERLRDYDVVVWNNTGGELLAPRQRRAFQEFIRHGGGYVGVHMAIAGNGATEPNWTWYAEFVGAKFRSHPPGTPAAILHAAAAEHPSAAKIPHPWSHADEWYEWLAPPEDNPAITVTLYVDERSYGGRGRHAVAWCRDFEDGRMFYTALGHTEACFDDENFRRHLAGGIEWAGGLRSRPTESEIATPGLIVDLDADEGILLEDGDRVARWSNQVAGAPGNEFVKRDEGRAVAGSGRPTLQCGVAALNGHSSLVFGKSELVGEHVAALAELITGQGYTWIVVMAPHVQPGTVRDVNVFIGNLRNGGCYEGFWGGLDDDNTVWIGSRNGRSFGRYDANNPKVVGPRLPRGEYALIAARMAAGASTVPLELFVNDANAVATGYFPVNPAAQSSRLAIGQERDAINHPGLESFHGEIARVLIYRRPLNDLELAETMAALWRRYFSGSAHL